MKRIIIALMMLVGLTIIPAQNANASFNEGYFRNDSCVGYNQCAGVGLSLYPNYSGYQTVVAPNKTYRNYSDHPSPEAGDLVYIYIGPGWRCTIDKWDLRYPGEGTYGRLLSRQSDVTGYRYSRFSSPYWFYTIWACHQG